MSAVQLPGRLVRIMHLGILVSSIARIVKVLSSRPKRVVHSVNAYVRVGPS